MGTVNNLLYENRKTNLNNHNLVKQALQRLLRHSLQKSAMRVIKSLVTNERYEGVVVAQCHWIHGNG
jgi:hypothetical protein